MPSGSTRKTIEVSALRVLVVRREHDALSVRRPRRAEVGAAKMRDLRLVRSVGVHDEELDLGRTNEILRKKIAIRLELGRISRMIGAIDDSAFRRATTTRRHRNPAYW